MSIAWLIILVALRDHFNCIFVLAIDWWACVDVIVLL